MTPKRNRTRSHKSANLLHSLGYWAAKLLDKHFIFRLVLEPLRGLKAHWLFPRPTSSYDEVAGVEVAITSCSVSLCTL